MVELYVHSPMRLHDVLLNQVSTGTTLPFNLTVVQSGSKLL
jgi:hypothetical protein